VVNICPTCNKRERSAFVSILVAAVLQRSPGPASPSSGDSSEMQQGYWNLGNEVICVIISLARARERKEDFICELLFTVFYHSLPVIEKREE
jgi:hypothetical protein